MHIAEHRNGVCMCLGRYPSLFHLTSALLADLNKHCNALRNWSRRTAVCEAAIPLHAKKCLATA